MNVPVVPITATLILASVFVGCGGGHPQTVGVTGTVEYRGEPVVGAGVTFIPVEGRSASGMTDEQGRFELTTFAPGDGALVGEHKVAITPPTEEIPEIIPDDYDYTAVGTGEPAIPRKYAVSETSDLTATVTADGDNHFEFVLSD